jgi:hypothetical protein
VLKRHGRDLTADAAEGRLDPLIGRQDVMERALQVGASWLTGSGAGCAWVRQTPIAAAAMTCSNPAPAPCSSILFCVSLTFFQVLLRRTKNNPVLIGDPGVGKTAVAEGIAQLIVSPAAPPGLAGRALIALDVGSLVSGTQYRGAFEERITVGGCLGGCFHVGLSVGMEGGRSSFGLLGPTSAPLAFVPLTPSHPCHLPYPLPPLPTSQSLLNEVRLAAGRIILFIDELHMLMDAGRVEGGMNAGGWTLRACVRARVWVHAALPFATPCWCDRTVCLYFSFFTSPLRPPGRSQPVEAGAGEG